jgi:hypothetical protein
MHARGERLPENIPLLWFVPLGVRLHAKGDWPKVRNAYVDKVKADMGTTIHTVQEWVSGPVVEKKMRAIGSGQKPTVGVVFREDGKTWVFDGHHTLVAYFLLGRTPVFALHDPERGRVLAPPKLLDVKGAEVRLSKRAR